MSTEHEVLECYLDEGIWLILESLNEPFTATLMDSRSGRSYSSFTRRLTVMVSKFEGQYVAMVDGRVLAHGRDAKQVYDRARRVVPKGRIFLGQVPTKQVTVLFLRRDSRSQRLNRSYSAR